MHLYRTLTVILFISSIIFEGYAQVDPLSLLTDWSFREGTSALWHPAQVPGTVQEDLLRLGKLPDPFVGTNEDSLLWVEEKDWVYKTSFELSEKQLAKEFHTLIFHGLDTYAEVFLNGVRVLTADNMFRKWEIKVAEYLQRENELKIYFHSPIKKGKAYLDDLPYRLPTGNDVGAVKVAPVVRKAAFHFGWDWGPRIVTSGIWRPVELLSWDGARHKSARIKTIEITRVSPTISSANITLDVDIESEVNIDEIVTSWIEGQGTSIQLLHKDKRELTFQITNPELWWPNGLGDQKLYTLNFKYGFYESVPDKPDFSITTGIRKAELINEPDSLGTSFYFKINDRPIFAKGANYIPQRHLTNTLTRKNYRELLTTAAETNMNMIRVWGGGIYEEDYFYELCDSLGLMVWQDFMFANTIYPVDSSFTNNILAEVKDNVERLGHHPSIVHWCGNNEIDVAWHNWGWQKEYEIKESHQDLLYDNYKLLFQKEIPNLLRELLPTSNYSHTSPLSNWGTEENFNHGSMHYWGVFHGEDPFEDYAKNIGRFNSEYGFQTFPNINVIQDYFEPASFDLEDPLLSHRQKSYKGNRLIYKHTGDYYPQPMSMLQLSYLSQLTQARGITMAIQAHRLDQPRCMGTLYWQLNDCWPAVSWSSLDFNGQWKALHYAVRDAYEPVTCVVDTSGGRNSLILINDSPDSVNVSLTLANLDGKTLYNQSLSLPERGRVRQDHNDLVGIKDQKVFRLLLQNDGITLMDKLLWMDEDIELEVPKLEMQLIDETLVIQSNTLVKSLYLHSSEGYHFSDNFLDLTAGTEYEIVLSHPEKKSFQLSKIDYISLNNLAKE